MLRMLVNNTINSISLHLKKIKFNKKDSRCDFDLAVFCTTLSRREDEGDNTNFNTSMEAQAGDIDSHIITFFKKLF